MFVALVDTNTGVDSIGPWSQARQVIIIKELSALVVKGSGDQRSSSYLWLSINLGIRVSEFSQSFGNDSHGSCLEDIFIRKNCNNNVRFPCKNLISNVKICFLTALLK